MATYATYRHVELDNVGYGKKRVLKPPGGGTSDIFGAAPDETSPRRIKNHHQSQLGSALFGDNNVSGNGSETPRISNKPGNDSYKRLFGPPDPPTPNSKNHMRSNISLSGESTATTSPAKSTSSNSSTGSGVLCNGTVANGNHSNDFAGGSSCMPRNPVTGDGVDVTPFRRIVRKSRDGNPVTGTGYSSESVTDSSPSPNANVNGSSEKSGESSPSFNGVSNRVQRNRVPPGGYSSGLW